MLRIVGASYSIKNFHPQQTGAVLNGCYSTCISEDETEYLFVLVRIKYAINSVIRLINFIDKSLSQLQHKTTQTDAHWINSPKANIRSYVSKHREKSPVLVQLIKVDFN